ARRGPPPAGRGAGRGAPRRAGAPGPWRATATRGERAPGGTRTPGRRTRSAWLRPSRDTAGRTNTVHRTRSGGRVIVRRGGQPARAEVDPAASANGAGCTGAAAGAAEGLRHR